MAKKNKGMLLKVGSWSFILGIIIAIVAGLFQETTYTATVLILLGVLVGFLNITGEEAMTFLLASVSLVVISWVGGPTFSEVAVIGRTLQVMLNNMMIFVIPASIIVALRAVLTLAHKK